MIASKRPRTWPQISTNVPSGHQDRWSNGHVQPRAALSRGTFLHLHLKDLQSSLRSACAHVIMLLEAWLESSKGLFDEEVGYFLVLSGFVFEEKPRAGGAWIGNQGQPWISSCRPVLLQGSPYYSVRRGGCRLVYSAGSLRSDTIPALSLPLAPSIEFVKPYALHFLPFLDHGVGLIRQVLLKSQPQVDVAERQYPRRKLCCIDGIVDAKGG